MTKLVRGFASRRPLLLIFAAVLLAKTIILFLDSTPRLFMGDSGSYLATALTSWIPPDRSFVYGFLIRPVALWTHSLQPLVWSQVALSALSAWLVAVCLVRYLQTSLSVAFLCSLFCAVEPLQLLAERFVLTETAVTLVFAVFTLLCFRYLATADLVPLAFIQLCGVLLIGLRISFLPLVILCSFSLPFFTMQAAVPPRVSLGRRLIRPVLLGLLLSQLLLFGYRHLYGHLIGPPMRGNPAYFYREGLFLISDFAPLLKPIDYPIASQRSRIFSPSRVPLPNPENRDAQRWYPDGICDRIAREFDGDEQLADLLAHTTAIRALERDPIAAIRLALQTARLYFDRTYFLDTLRIDEGYENQFTASQTALFRRNFGVDFSQENARLRQLPPLTERWHRTLYFWYWFLLLLPFIFLARLAFHVRRALPAHWLCAFFLLIFFEGVTLTVTRPTARFLTSTAWLSFVVLGACLSGSLAFRPTGHRSQTLAHVS